MFAELAAAGLVHRAPNAHDGRGAILGLTSAGTAVLHQDMAGRDRWLAAALGEFSDLEVGVLRLAADLLDRLADTDPTLDGADASTDMGTDGRGNAERQAPA